MFRGELARKAGESMIQLSYIPLVSLYDPFLYPISTCPLKEPVSPRRSPRLNSGGRYSHHSGNPGDVPPHRLLPQSPRFAQTKRPYTAADVVSKRGTIKIEYPSNVQAKKLWALLSEHAKRGTTSHTYGA